MSGMPAAEKSCRGCGAPASADSPTPDHCGDCHPWTCDQCGRACSMADPCSCWTSLEGMALADIKGRLALGDLSVTPAHPLTGEADA